MAHAKVNNTLSRGASFRVRKGVWKKKKGGRREINGKRIGENLAKEKGGEKAERRSVRFISQSDTKAR